MKNPFPIQEGPTRRTPLFLIHDGGGTIFHYCLLQNLDRNVWGVYNPKFDNGEEWTGGLSEMAKVYVTMLKSVITCDNVIIGGWSLGGCIALEMAHLLQEDVEIHVQGLVMIDSIYPKYRPDASASETYFLKFFETVPKDVRMNVQRCVDQAVYMLSRWRGPDWSRQEVGKGSVGNLFPETTGPPPAVLIRATEKLPTNWKRLDAEPEDMLLRWDMYWDNLFKKVLDVPGHHFSMFERQYVRHIL
ncbi:hypothetical protein P3342_001745 [Pyrenophora teres f. teres]|nr:hypothetical protein P3342_001745 [Pyrenophora teres f. teres]